MQEPIYTEVWRYWSNNIVNKLQLKVVSKVLSPLDNKTIVSHKNSNKTIRLLSSHKTENGGTI